MATPHNQVKSDRDPLKAIQQKLYTPGSRRRKLFGLLERPSIPPSIPQVSYKICIIGSSSSGKTHLVHRLTGNEIQSHLTETVGIEVSYVYWPLMIGNRMMLFRLELWDTGESSAKRYNHIKPACNSAVDGIIACFSVTSRDQWIEVPKLIEEANGLDGKPSVVLVSTRWDRPTDIAVSDYELKTFETKEDVSLLRLPPASSHSGEENANVTPILNYICRQLWHRDQQLLASGKNRG